MNSKIKIFTQVEDRPTIKSAIIKDKDDYVFFKQILKDVSDFVKDRNVSIVWLQSSGGFENDSFTQLTAIVIYQ